jgi:hypothetical protein
MCWIAQEAPSGTTIATQAIAAASRRIARFEIILSPDRKLGGEHLIAYTADRGSAPCDQR